MFTYLWHSKCNKILDKNYGIKGVHQVLIIMKLDVYNSFWNQMSWNQVSWNQVSGIDFGITRLGIRCPVLG